MPDNERRYPVAYKVDPKANRTKAELLGRDEGGCDGLILISLIFRENGSRSQATVSVDGRTGGDLSFEELFKSWVMLAHTLKDEQALSPAKRELCAIVFEAIRQTKVPGPHPTLISLIRDRALEDAAQECEAKTWIEAARAIRAMKGAAAVEPEVFTCPACGIVSHNPNDARHRYCARCKRFFPAARPTEVQLGPAMPAPPPSLEPPGPTIEPTAEQIDKIATAISVASSDSYALENPRDVELEGAARAMWRLIAPMVLEAAEQACEQVRSKVEPASLDIPLVEFTQKDHEAAGVLKCIAAIRAMKGTPDRDTDGLIRRIEGELPPEWEQHGPDHWGCWGCDLPGRIRLSVWPRSDGRWVWEIFQVERDAGSGDEASFDAAKGAAIKAATQAIRAMKGTP